MIRRILVFLAAALAAAALWATPEVRFESFNRQSFDQVFSNADRRGDGLEWREAVESGTRALQARWEAEALLRITEAVTNVPAGEQQALRTQLEQDMAVAKAAWEAEALALADARLGRYLAGRETVPGPAPDRDALLQALGAASGAHTNADFMSDLAGWDSALALHRATNRAAVAALLHTRLTNLITVSGLSNRVLAGYVDTLLARAGDALLDWDLTFDYIVTRNRNRYVAYRLYDRSSLKLDADAASARQIVQGVITTAGGEAKKSVEDYLKQHGVVLTDPALPDLSALGADWQAKVQQAIDTGLSRWKTAYDDLLTRMNDWEAGAQGTIEAGNKLWGEAYKQIQEARDRWLVDIRAQIDAGLDAWERKEAQALLNRSEAVGRLDGFIQQQQAEWDGYTGQINTLFAQGSGAIKTARQNVEWLTNIIAGYRTLAFPNGVFDGGSVHGTVYSFYTNELARWEGIRVQFEQLTANALSRFHNGDMWSGTVGISMLTNSADAYLYTGTEFSLVRIEREMAWWSNRLEIAQTVYAYATNTGAGRESAAATQVRLDAARAALLTAEAAYTNALGSLNTFASSNLTWFQGVLASNQSVLGQAQAAFQTAQQEYNDKLYFLRLLENATNSADILDECNQNYAAYEHSRLQTASAWSNYLERYVTLASNEGVYGYARLLADAAGAADPARAAYAGYLGIVTNIIAADTGSLAAQAGALAAALPALLPDGETAYRQLCLSNAVSDLLYAGTNALEAARRGFALTALVREIGRQLALPALTTTAVLQAALDPVGLDPEASYTAMLAQQYAALSNRAAANLAAVELVHQKAEDYCHAMRVVMGWTHPTGDLETVFFGSDLTGRLADYVLADPTAGSQGDAVRYLYAWYDGNKGLLDSIWTNDPAAIEPFRAELLQKIETLQSNAAYAAAWFTTNSFGGEQDLARADAFLYGRVLAAEAAVGDFSAAAQTDLIIANEVLALAEGRWATMQQASGARDRALYTDLRALLQDPQAIAGLDIAGLKALAEKVLQAVGGTDMIIPDFVLDAVQAIADRAADLETRQYLFDKVGGGSVSSNAVAAAYATAASNAGWHATGMQLAQHVVLAADGTVASNLGAVMGALATNARYTAYLAAAPAGFLQLLTNASGDTLAALQDAAYALYDGSASNQNLHATEAGKLAYALSWYGGGIKVSSMRDYLFLLTAPNQAYDPAVTNAGDPASYKTVPVSILTQSGASGDWSVDTANSGNGSLLTHAVFTNTLGNSLLDAAAALADSLGVLSGTVLPAYERYYSGIAAGCAAYLTSFNAAYNPACGITDGAGYAAFTNAVASRGMDVASQNTGNDSTLVTLQNNRQGTAAGASAALADLQKNGQFYYLVKTTSAKDYMDSPEVKAARDAVALREKQLLAAQTNHDTARAGYDNASAAYFNDMSTVGTLGKTYEAAKHRFDLAQAVQTYAATPYSTADGGTAASNSAADARAAYEQILQQYTRVYDAYTNARVAYDNRLTLGKLDTAAGNAAYRDARDAWTNATLSCLRLDKGYTDMTVTVADIKAEIAKLKDQTMQLEAVVFQDKYDEQSGGIELQQQLLRRLFITFSTPQEMVGDFFKWITAVKLDSTIFQQSALNIHYDNWRDNDDWYAPYWYGVRKDTWYTSTTGMYSNQNDWDAAFASMDWRQLPGLDQLAIDPYTDPDGMALYSRLFSSDSPLVRSNAFFAMGDAFQYLQGFQCFVDYFEQRRADFNDKLHDAWRPSKRLFYRIRRNYFEALRNDARGDQNPYKQTIESISNKLVDTFTELKGVYEKIHALEERIGALCKITVGSALYPGADPAAPGVVAALTAFQADLTGKLGQYGIKATDAGYFAGGSGLTNLAHALRDLGAVKRTAQMDQFGNILYAGTNIQYEYWVDVSDLLGRLKNLRLGDQAAAFNTWQASAATHGVDAPLFLKDRERALHGVLVHAHDTIKNAREYETYVTITAQLTAVGSEAWGMIKTQERDLQMQQWDFTLQALALDRQRWYNTAVDIFGRGTDQWAGMDAQFNSAWNGWLSTTKDKLETERQKWIAAADGLVKGRDSWLADVSAAASRGAADTLALAGLDKIEASINGVLGSLPGAFSTPDFDADKLAADILRDNRVAMLPVDFMKLMDSANINFSITELSRMGTAGATTGFDRMLQDFERAGAVMENMRLFDSLDRTIDSYKKMLAEADKQTAKGVADSLLKEGFKQSGADWTRRAIVDATIWGAQWDTQVVPGYEFYTPPEFQYNIKADGATFTPDKLAAMSTAEVQALATAARINLKKQFDALMGDDADDPQNKQSLQYHIGKVPSVDDGKVKWSTGLGQMKDVIGTMIDKNIQKARGEAKANGPFWSKPLWDSDKDNDGSNDGFFGAPNIMTIAKIAVSVAGGGPWLSFALDAFDTAYNVAAGNMSLKDGAIGLAKGAAVATVSSLGVSTFIGNTVGAATAGLGSVVSSTLSAVAQNYSSSLINGAINAFNGENGWSFSSFKQSAKDGLKGAAIAGTTALVGGLINNANGMSYGKYKNPNGTESTGWHTTQSGVLDNMSSSISSIGNFWGGLAGQAMSFAMGDGFSLNMLNSADFGVGNAGLLELRIGGKQKNLFSFALGSGGADISDSMLNQMEAGQNHLNWVDKMMSSGAPEIAIQAEMAKINMMRWAGGRAAQLAELEVGGMIKSMFNGGDLNSSRGLMTTLGLDDIETDANGDITLASQARLAVRQTHESEHVMQNIASYSSGVSMMAMDRELGAHESGISAWQGLLSTFGSGLGSTSRGSAIDQAFASEMSSLSLGMANGQLERHLGANYSMSGDDWLRKGSNPQANQIIEGLVRKLGNAAIIWDANGNAVGIQTLDSMDPTMKNIFNNADQQGKDKIIVEQSKVRDALMMVINSKERGIDLGNVDNVAVFFDGVLNPYNSVTTALKIDGIPCSIPLTPQEGFAVDYDRSKQGNFNSISSANNLNFHLVRALYGQGTQPNTDPLSGIQNALSGLGYAGNIADIIKPDNAFSKAVDWISLADSALKGLNAIASDGIGHGLIQAQGVYDTVVSSWLGRFPFSGMTMGSGYASLYGVLVSGMYKLQDPNSGQPAFQDQVDFEKWTTGQRSYNYPSENDNSTLYKDWRLLKFTEGESGKVSYSAISPFGEIESSYKDPYGRYRNNKGDYFNFLADQDPLGWKALAKSYWKHLDEQRIDFFLKVYQKNHQNYGNNHGYQGY